MMDAATYRKLTPREREVLAAAAAGRSAKHIGLALGISHRTVEDALYTARTKLQVSRSIVAGQMLVAYEAGLDAPVEIPVAGPVGENVAGPATSAASPLPDALPQPQASPPPDHRLQEAPLAFEWLPPDEAEPGTRKRLVDAIPRGVLVILASAIAIPLVLALLTILYLGLSTIERVSLIGR